MLRVTIQANDLRREMEMGGQLKKRELDKIKRRMRAHTLDFVRRVKQEMPVDTGRARASFGAFTPEFLRMLSGNVNPSDAVYEVRQDGLEILVGTRVEYVAALNEGTSTQAPAGFIDRNIERTHQDLVQGIAKDFTEA